MSRKNRKSSKRRGTKSKSSKSDAGPQPKSSGKPTAEVKPCVTDSKIAPVVETNDNAQAFVTHKNTAVAVPGTTTAYEAPLDSAPGTPDRSHWPLQLTASDTQQQPGGNRQLGSGESLADRMQRLACQDASFSYLGPCYHHYNDPYLQKGGCFPTRSEGDDDLLPSLRFEPSRTAVGTTALVVPIDGITQVKSLNCIRITKELETVAPDGIRRVRLNTRLNLLAVDTLKTEVTAALMGIRRLCGVAVEVHEPRSTFKAVGVVNGIPPGMTATDIEAAIRSAVPVLNVRIPHPPSPAIVTFASAQIPDYVNIGFVQHRVHLYVDRPARCKLCGRIGHVMAVCPRPPAFLKGTSGAVNGDSNSDTSAARRQHCLNCGQDDHDTRSKTCPRWLELLEVSRYRRVYDVNARTAKAAVAASKAMEARSRSVKDDRHHVIRCINSMLANSTSSDVASEVRGNTAPARIVYTVEELLRIGLGTPICTRPQHFGTSSRCLHAWSAAGSIASLFLQKTFIAFVRIFFTPVRSFTTAYHRRFSSSKPAGDGMHRPREKRSTADLPFMMK
ncbi:uncharacterized protein [Dermacentor andersoni]|uniref:uncharacterized protein n=1 Tax=Dermacentor andersoni TaxID=34620 RepID=UPI002155364C|nr:uncharacterized protein LOC126539543 [Dermacentor andersoni]